MVVDQRQGIAADRTRLAAVCVPFLALFLFACRAAPSREETEAVDRISRDSIGPWLSHVDPTLRYRFEPWPAAENAWTDWIQLDPAGVEAAAPGDEGLEDWLLEVDWLEEDQLPGGDLGRRLGIWLDEKLVQLVTLDQGAAKGRLQIPQKEQDRCFRLVLVLWKACSLRVLEVKRLAADGRFDEAVDRVERLLEVSEVVSRSDGPLLCFFSGVALEALALKSMRWLAGRRELPEPNLERLRVPTGGRDDLRGVWATELCRWVLPEIVSIPDSAESHELAAALTSDALRLLEEEPPPEEEAVAASRKRLSRAEDGMRALLEDHPNPFDKRGTVELASACVARVVRNAERPWPDRERDLGQDVVSEVDGWPDELWPYWVTIGGLLSGAEDPPEIPEETITRARERLREVTNPLGKRLVADFFRPMLEELVSFSVAERSCELVFQRKANRAATRAVLALRRYERRHDRLPDSLAALVGEGLLPEEPEDSFAAAPLQYSSERRILWSVGPDGVDHGGLDLLDKGAHESDEEGEDEETGEDMVWRIPPLAPARSAP